MSDMFLSGTTTAIALASATAKTLAQVLAPTNHRVKVLGYGVWFDGSLSTTAVPIRIRLLNQSTSGTMTSGSLVQVSPRAETALSQFFYSATAEPTLVSAVDEFVCNPTQGWEVKFPPGQEPVIAGGGRMGIEAYCASIGGGINAYAKILLEE